MDDADSRDLDQRKTLQSQTVAKSPDENDDFEKQRTAAIAEVAKTKEVREPTAWLFNYVTSRGLDISQGFNDILELVFEFCLTNDRLSVIYCMNLICSALVVKGKTYCNNILSQRAVTHQDHPWCHYT